MIMGVISLGVFLTLELGGVGDTVGFYAFEFAHIVIFFTALIFVMQVTNANKRSIDFLPVVALEQYHVWSFDNDDLNNV